MKKTALYIVLIYVTSGCANYDADPNLLGILLIPGPVEKIPITPGGVNPLTEGGVSEALNINLPEIPTDTVTILIATDTQLSIDTNSLLFTPQDWNIAKSIIVTAVDDFDIENTHSGKISFTSDSRDPRYFHANIRDVIVSIVDNESAGVSIVESGGSTNIIERGVTDSYTVVLTTNITSNVTITVDPTIQSNLGSGDGTPITLTFTSSNWSIPQTVTVTASDDVVAEGNHTSAITHTIATGPAEYLALGPSPASFQTVTANITDNDTAILNLGGTIIVDESGPIASSFTANLGYRPDADVTVQFTPADANIDLGSGAGVAVSRTFTGNVACGASPIWCANFTIPVTAVDDGVSEGVTHTRNITATVTAGPAAYLALAPKVIVATIIDNETDGVYTVESGGSTNVSEGGATDSYTMKLTADPVAPAVTITITPDPQLDLGSGAGVAITRTFTGGACGVAPSWCATQTITVTANNDAIAEGTHTGTITHAITAGPGAYFALNPMPSINVSITDNEKRIFVTASTWQGQNVGNIASADAKCAADGNKPAGGTWRALLAEPNAPGRRASLTANAGDGQLSWILRANYNYYNSTGLQHLFTTNANRLFVFGNFVNAVGAGVAWTGLNADWTSKSVVGTCAGWASALGTGGSGDTSQTNSTAINNADAICNGPAHSLICVEQ